MYFIKNKYSNTILAVFSILLLIFIFIWINFLTNNKYIIECFTSDYMKENKDSTSHTVDLPLTTKYSCSNFCGPTARCAITGQQCFTDIDCPGCQPYSPPLSKNAENCVPGNNDAGKLTVGVTPQYSPLTSGYGTQEKIITNNMFSKPDMPNFGVNTWFKEFKEEENLFNKRYKPTGLQFMPDYTNKYSLSGQFIDDGPYPSNSEFY